MWRDKNSAHPIQSPIKRGRPPRLAIIGGGISGLSSAYALCDHCDVTLFEKRDRLGGHARTIMAGPNRDIAVDTGFMVFNYRNYPHLNRLFSDLDVPVEKTDMTFSVSLDEREFEFGIQDLGRIFADKRNLFRPAFWKLLKDILIFNQEAKNKLADDPTINLEQLMTRLGVSETCLTHYLGPLSGAIWSSSVEEMKAFPAKTLIDFFTNHGLLSQSDYLQWYTPSGGSKIYVERLKSHLIDQGCYFQLGANISHINRNKDHVEICHDNGDVQTFDYVIFACHSDQALALMSDPSDQEREILGAIKYKRNHVVLHSDVRQMPRRRAAWSSWVYKGRSDDHSHNSFTYWMNNLQNIPMSQGPLFVTLNPQDDIATDKIYDETYLAHPQFTLEAMAAQSRLPDIQGQARSYFCGAYARYGFHEDGIWSAYQAADQFLAHMALSKVV